jgi:hypothetical protein
VSEEDFRVLVTMSDAGSGGFRDDWQEDMALPVYQDYRSHDEKRFEPGFRQSISHILAELGN